MTETTGALVLGGNLSGLSIARSLGRRGVPVWVTTSPNIKLASCSRYTLRTVPWPSGESEAQVTYLLELAERYQLDQWVLFPTCDVLRWAYDKRLTYRLAAEQQVDYPLTINPATEQDLDSFACAFPAVLKPATHATINRFTADKAWPVTSREELLTRYRKARELIPSDLILVQERF